MIFKERGVKVEFFDQPLFVENVTALPRAPLLRGRMKESAPDYVVIKEVRICQQQIDAFASIACAIIPPF